MGFNDLTTRILGPNSLVQGAVPEILATTPQSYFDDVMELLAVSLSQILDLILYDICLYILINRFVGECHYSL